MAGELQQARSKVLWAVLLFWLVVAGRGDAGNDNSRFRTVLERSLPASLERAKDVRWASSTSVYLAVSLTGAVELSLSAESGDFELVTLDGSGQREVWLTSHLGVSETFFAVAAPVFSVGWKKIDSETPDLAGRASLEGIEDIDVFQNRLAVLGLRRDENGQISKNGAIGWIGSLDLDLSDLKPVLFSSSGPGARPMDACINFEIGVIRFFVDGSFLVVPGAEPGAFLYDLEGKLLHTWETEPLGLDARCDFDDVQRDLMSSNPLPRWAWVNRFRTVDEILPLPEGPGLVIREASAEGTRWEVLVLSRTGPARRFDLPIESPSSLVHLHADVREERIVFLLTDKAIVFDDGPKKEAAEKTRLIVAEIARGNP